MNLQTDTNTDEVYQRWTDQTGQVGLIEHYYRQWKVAVKTYGKQACLVYIEERPATKPGIIINRMDKDSAEGKLKKETDKEKYARLDKEAEEREKLY